MVISLKVLGLVDFALELLYFSHHCHYKNKILTPGLMEYVILIMKNFYRFR